MDEVYVDYVQVFEGNDGQWYFHAKSNNGKVLLASEGYKERTTAKRFAEDSFPGKRIDVIPKAISE